VCDTVQYPEEILHSLLVTWALLQSVYHFTAQQAGCLQASSTTLAFEVEAISRWNCFPVYRRNGKSETRSDFAQ